MKVKFVRADNSIIAITRYAGKTLRASAKCNPEDKFDEDKGRKLAEARLKVKLVKHRKNWAMRQMIKADIEYIQALRKARKMNKYVDDTWLEYENAMKNLKEIEEKI